MMAIFKEFGEIRRQEPSAPEVQGQVKKLQDFISQNLYSCSDAVLSSLGRMYAESGEFTANIDKAGGEGTAAFVNRAIQEYCSKN